MKSDNRKSQWTKFHWIAFLVFAQLLFAFASVAQQQTVTGTVTDSETGEALPGVNIVIKGTTTGTISDVDGNYRINVNNLQTDVLEFRFIGFAEQEVPLNGRTVVDVAMEMTSFGIDEVVAVGYGTVRKRDLTGSVSSVSGESLQDIPVASTAQALTGRLAGVQITTTEGSPDAEIKIRVRGGGSITQDNSPLYIVDGFPVSSINDIAPTDIASIDVLKDASSTAIYGARGANGVIIITTKDGVEGDVSVNYNMYYGVKQIAGTLDVLSPYEYVLWQYELAGESGNTARNFQRYYGVFGDLELYKAQKGSNWQEELFGRDAVTQYHNASVTGGSSRTRYNLSMTRTDDQGIMLGSGYVRNNINLRLNSKVSDRVTLDFNTRFADTNVTGAGTSTEGSSTNSRLKHAIKYSPVRGLQEFLEAVDFDTDMEAASQLYNPVDVVNDDYRSSDRKNITFNAGASFELIDGLVLKSDWGVEFENRRDDRFYGPSTSQSKNNSGGTPMVNVETREGLTQRVANTLSYAKNDLFPGHDLTVLLGQEIYSFKTKRIEMESRFFPNDVDQNAALAMLNLGTPQPTVSFISPENKLSSFFGRVNYNILERFLATFTFRADGSSKFAAGNRWGYFPSAAIAWRLSEESFLQGADFLSNLKLRASYGTAGNNRIDDDMWKMLYTTSDGNKPYYIDENLQNQLVPGTTIANPDLRWETTYTRNVGLDFGLFNSRVNGTIDAYLNNTRDLLIRANIPSNTGYDFQMQNIGETSNKGIELSLDGYLVQTRDFSLNASFNIAFNVNKVEELGDVKMSLQSSGWYGSSSGPTGDYLLQEGQPVGQMWGYVTDGMYRYDDFDYNPETESYTLKPGVPDNSALIGARFFGPGTLKFKKLSGEGTVINPDEDRTIIGNANPKHTGGFNLTATYKGLDFSAFFNWVYGNDIYNANKLEFTSFPDTRLYGNLLDMMKWEDRFSTINRETGEFVYSPEGLAALNQNVTIWHPMMSRVVLHSWAIEDGSFLRLNNLTLGYTLPQSLTSRAFIERLRFYVTGYNLFILTNYSGYDPEVDTRRSTPLTPGVDYSAYPRSRSIIAGVNVTF
ncbi:MAG TPA: TonB-dependent receptor [Mariniphaga anaerophila]|uniref:TonB-dependent receptor n=1 Tax=Mariniphaga anaerophila TaxID=1484053 RepID=A0A831LWG6_9BACT|nr:TonB-dependent receptor [Mariniphaga anaerophila]